jgi:hypothetical protein
MMREEVTGQYGKHISMPLFTFKQNSKSMQSLWPCDQSSSLPNFSLHTLTLHRSHDKVRDQISAHVASISGVNKTYRRNASLATMKFAFDLEKNGKVRDFGYPPIGYTRHITPQAASILEYLFKYGHTASAFGDVKEYIEKLAKRDQQQLIWCSRAILMGRVQWAWVEDHVGTQAPLWTSPQPVSLKNLQRYASLRHANNL